MIAKIVEYLDEVVAGVGVVAGIALVFLGSVEEGKWLITFFGGYLFGKNVPKVQKPQ